MRLYMDKTLGTIKRIETDDTNENLSPIKEDAALAYVTGAVTRAMLSVHAIYEHMHPEDPACDGVYEALHRLEDARAELQGTQRHD